MKLTPHTRKILTNSKKDKAWINQEKNRQAVRQESKKASLVATQLAYYLRSKKITQTRLGQLIEVSPQQISKLLTGKENLTLSTIEKIEHALGIVLINVSNLEVEHTNVSQEKGEMIISS